MLKDLGGPIRYVCVCVCVCQAKDKFKKYANIPYSSLIFYLVSSGAVGNYFRKFFNMHNLGSSSVYMWKQSAFCACVCVCGCARTKPTEISTDLLEILLLSNSNCKYFSIPKCIQKLNKPRHSLLVYCK